MNIQILCWHFKSQETALSTHRKYIQLVTMHTAFAWTQELIYISTQNTQTMYSSQKWKDLYLIASLLAWDHTVSSCTSLHWGFSCHTKMGAWQLYSIQIYICSPFISCVNKACFCSLLLTVSISELHYSELLKCRQLILTDVLLRLFALCCSGTDYIPINSCTL